MNYAPLIFEKVKEEGGAVEITLVAGAPIFLRKGRTLSELTHSPLTPNDVKETLISLREHASHQQRLEPHRGVFSFGLEGLGRFRVIYFTQRGSLVLSILRTPFEPPRLTDLVENYTEIGGELRKALSNNSLTCILTFSREKLGEFLLSFVSFMGERYRRIFYTLERPMVYLLKHSTSAFIQREVGVDVQNLREGILDALGMSPDLVILYDLFTPDTELINLIAEFYPPPFPLMFGLTGSSLEDLYRILETAGKRDFANAITNVWTLKQVGGKIKLEKLRSSKEKSLSS